MRPMQRKGRRTVIDISRQPGLAFDDDNFRAEFTLPAYQNNLLFARTYALIIDLGIVFGLFMGFVFATMSEMAGPPALDRVVLGVYAAAYLMLLVAYLTLFMLSTGQTTGMRIQGLIVVDRRGRALGPPEACLRAFGYLISAIPVMFGFAWAFVDPEHLTWADKVSGTFVKRSRAVRHRP
jgi:uncharacterized RDD family membrane protein YckC